MRPDRPTNDDLWQSALRLLRTTGGRVFAVGVLVINVVVLVVRILGDSSGWKLVSAIGAVVIGIAFNMAAFSRRPSPGVSESR
jgi:hypothetical protein